VVVIEAVAKAEQGGCKEGEIKGVVHGSTGLSA
jgi:hypothetical protein